MAKAKSAARKTAPKKKKAKLPQAPAEHFFVLVDGRVLRDYKELADALPSMADHVYGHHVNWERNDFSNWIGDIFKDKELADALRGASSKHHSHIIISKHITERT